MNRQQRRADKRTHRLPPQVSVLWIPDARGYLERFAHGQFSVVENAQSAMHLPGDRATVTASNFKRVTGLSAAVRPFRNIQ